MNQIKTDGIGFQMIMPHELPQLVTTKSEDGAKPIDSHRGNSTDPDFHRDPSSDPLLDFLTKRKNLRLQFENRYSRKAIGLRAYLKQKDSPQAPMIYNGILINHFPE